MKMSLILSFCHIFNANYRCKQLKIADINENEKKFNPIQLTLESFEYNGTVPTTS